MTKKLIKPPLTREEMIEASKTEIMVLLEEQKKQRAEAAERILVPLVDEAFRRTVAWASKHGYHKEKSPGKKNRPSKRAQAVQAFLEEQDFGCHNARVATLCAHLLGEPVVGHEYSLTAGVSFSTGVVVVPLENNNGNNYSLGEPVIMFADWGYSEKHVKRSGNSLSTTRDALRPATRMEIAALLGTLIVNGDDGAKSALWSLLPADNGGKTA